MTSQTPDLLQLLLERAWSGDLRAWNDFFAEIRTYLHAEFRRLAGDNGAGPLDASSIVQSSLRRIWKHIDTQFPNGAEDSAPARFLAWVKTIVRNRTLEEWRKLRRRRTVPAGSGIEDVAAPPAPLDAGKRDRIAMELAAALANLPEKKRRVVELFWFEQLPDIEIGMRLGCSPGAVRVLRCRALRELRSPSLRSLLEEKR